MSARANGMLPSERVRDPEEPLCVGHLAGWFHVLSPHGELRSLPEKDLAAGRGVEGLVAGHEGFVRTAFPHEGGGWNARAFGRWITEQCATHGLVDLASLELRGLGTWRDSMGCAVAHCGDELVYSDKRVKPAGSIEDRIVWPAAPASERPASRAADRDDARGLLEVVLLDLRGRELTLHRFATISAADRFAKLNAEHGRWFAGVNLGQLLELAANQLREAAHAINQ